jgi:hypothetical protein
MKPAPAFVPGADRPVHGSSSGTIVFPAAEQGRGDAQHRVDERQLQVMVSVALVDER